MKGHGAGCRGKCLGADHQNRRGVSHHVRSRGAGRCRRNQGAGPDLKSRGVEVCRRNRGAGRCLRSREVGRRRRKGAIRDLSLGFLGAEIIRVGVGVLADHPEGIRVFKV